MRLIYSEAPSPHCRILLVAYRGRKYDIRVTVADPQEPERDFEIRSIRHVKTGKEIWIATAAAFVERALARSSLPGPLVEMV